MIRSSSSNSIHSSNSIRHTENRSSHALPKITKLSNTFKILSTVIAAGILITAGIVALALSSSLAIPCLIAGSVVFLGTLVLMAMSCYKKAQPPTEINRDINLTSIRCSKDNQAPTSISQNEPTVFPSPSSSRAERFSEESLNQSPINEKEIPSIERLQVRLEQSANKLQALQKEYLKELKAALENQQPIDPSKLIEKRKSLNLLIKMLNQTKNKPMRQQYILNNDEVRKAYLQNLIHLSIINEVLLKTEKYGQGINTEDEIMRIMGNLTFYKSLVRHYYSQINSEILFIDLQIHFQFINRLTIVDLQRPPSPVERQRVPIRFSNSSDTSENEASEEISL